MSEKRDPRARWLDEDPFEKMNNNSKTHTRARDAVSYTHLTLPTTLQV